MTFTSDAYLKYEFIKKSVDLLCAGAAWQGGSFVVDPTNESSKITSLVDTESLFSISKSLLLTGECILAILSNDSVEIKFINRDEIDQNPIYTIIQRSISSFMPKGDPVLLQTEMENWPSHDSIKTEATNNEKTAQKLHPGRESIHPEKTPG